MSGLLSHLGQRDGDSREYVGARGSRFVVFPGSALAKKPPAWVMAAELVETSRLFARTAARIEPAWVEEMAEHLVKRHHGEPHWSTRRGAAMVHERVTLYGLPVVEDRTVPYARVDPEHARELFIRHALVLDDWHGRHGFVAANRALVAESEDLEHRFRRTDLSADDQTLFAAYDERVPASVVSARHFESWWKKTHRRDPSLLEFSLDDLLGRARLGLREQDFPTEWTHGDLRLPLSYHFEPGTPDDGVAVHIPIEVLNQVSPVGFDRLVPGLREELVVALLRTLPKEVRKDLLPLPERAREFLAGLAADEPRGPSLAAEPLPTRLAGFVRDLGHGSIGGGSFRPEELADHLRMIFRVEGPGGQVLGQGRDLRALQHLLAPALRRALSDVVGDVERFGMTEWEIGDLPRVVEGPSGALIVRGFPALADDITTVSVRVLEDPLVQARAMWAGTRRLLRLTVPLPEKGIRGGLTAGQRRALGWSPYAGGFGALFDDVVSTVLDGLLRDHGGPVWTRDDFDLLRGQVAASYATQVRELLAVAARVVAADRVLEHRIDAMSSSPGLLPMLEDLAGQRVGLVHEGFVSAAGRDRMADVERYQKGMVHRLERMVEAPGRDRERMAVIARVQSRYEAALEAFPPGSSVDTTLEKVGWDIEELRVSLFAQTLGNPAPVSEARLMRVLDSLGA